MVDFKYLCRIHPRLFVLQLPPPQPAPREAWAQQKRPGHAEPCIPLPCTGPPGCHFSAQSHMNPAQTRPKFQISATCIHRAVSLCSVVQREVWAVHRCRCALLQAQKNPARKQSPGLRSPWPSSAPSMPPCAWRTPDGSSNGTERNCP